MARGHGVNSFPLVFSDHVFVGRHYFSEDILTQSVFIELGDKVQVVLNDACNIDLEAIISAFRNSPGVNKSKIKEDWIKNHYRWIVWKLASLERRFPNKFAGLLHPNTVNIRDLLYARKYPL